MSARTVQQVLSDAGAVYDPNDPFTAVYQAVATNNNPSHAPSGNAAFIEANLRYRGIIYGKQHVGDCGTPVRTGVSGRQAAVSAIGGAAAFDPEPFSKTALSIVDSIAGIFTAHHAQAVKTEQQTICDVALKLNSIIPQLDAMVVNGQITAQDGIGKMDQATQAAIQELGSIKKDCNAACVFTSVCQAHADFARTVYPQLGSGAVAAGTSALALPDESSVNTNPFGVQLAKIPQAPSSTYLWLGVAALLILAIVVIFAGGKGA